MPTAIVTGAAGGIGSAAAVELSRRGFSLVLMGKDRARLCQVRARLDESVDSISFEGDVSNPADAEEAVNLCNRRWGRLDVLVNNAAVIEPIADLHRSDVAEWRRNLEINLFGPFVLTRSALNVFVKQGAGAIVNVSSGAARNPVQQWSAYCAAKAGLAMLTRCIHAEYFRHGVRAVAFQPGRVDTPMRRAIIARQPDRRELGRTAPFWLDIFAGRGIAWLCEEGAEIYAGEEVSLEDPVFRSRVGLVPHLGSQYHCSD